MKLSSFAFGAGVAMVFSIWTGGGLLAQQSTTTTKPPMTGSTKPDHGKPASETSLPSSAPAATTKDTTGATDQSKTVKSMNNKAKSDIEATGK